MHNVYDNLTVRKCQDMKWKAQDLLLGFLEKSREWDGKAAAGLAKKYWQACKAYEDAYYEAFMDMIEEAKKDK